MFTALQIVFKSFSTSVKPKIENCKNVVQTAIFSSNVAFVASMSCELNLSDTCVSYFIHYSFKNFKSFYRSSFECCKTSCAEFLKLFGKITHDIFVSKAVLKKLYIHFLWVISLCITYPKLSLFHSHFFERSFLYKHLWNRNVFAREWKSQLPTIKVILMIFD